MELEDRLNRKSVHHSGGTGSYHSQAARYLDERLTVFVMSNNSRLWSGSIADEVARVLLPKKNATNNYNKRIKENSGLSNTEEITGQYRSPVEYLIRIEEKNNKIQWRNGNNNPFELTQEKNNIYTFGGGSKTKVGFYKNEMILFYPSGKTSVYRKIPYVAPTFADFEGYQGEYYSRELDVNFEIIGAKNNTLMISLPKRKKKYEVEILNRNELLIFDYILKIQRDQFNRVTGILLTTNRVLNNQFVKKTKLKFQPKIATENGSINVSNIGSRSGKSSRILLTKNYPNGNEIWSQQFGGKGYDKASSIIATDDGYLIIGSTSSYGNGNYDMYVIKTDKRGKKQWQNTYGGFYNEYGYSAEKVADGYLIKGTVQNCTSNSDIFTRKCTTNVWFVSIDKKGKEISNTILEEIKE